jgi:hypothetical protein
MDNRHLIPELYDPQKEDLVHLAGDDDDGYGMNTRLTKSALAHPEFRYRGRLVRAELYEIDGALALHAMCPRCENYIWIDGRRKAIDYDLETGVLSVEAYTCPWEQGRGTDGTRNDRMLFGTGLCRLRIAIDRNIAKEA